MRDVVAGKKKVPLSQDFSSFSHALASESGPAHQGFRTQIRWVQGRRGLCLSQEEGGHQQISTRLLKESLTIQGVPLQCKATRLLTSLDVIFEIILPQVINTVDKNSVLKKVRKSFKTRQDEFAMKTEGDEIVADQAIVDLFTNTPMFSRKPNALQRLWDSYSSFP